MGASTEVSTLRATWQAASSGTSEDLLAVDRVDTSWIALGKNGLTLTSKDGVSWLPSSP
ncbi:MAG: hypothetical protein WCP58_08540 [bacterium]